MKIKELISPYDGLFKNMPQEIWTGELDPVFMDVELLTRVGDLDASPLLEYFYDGTSTNVEGLAAGIYSKYQSNWKRIWDAVHATYDIMITTSHHEVRTSDLERNLTESGTDKLEISGADTRRNEIKGKVQEDGSGTTEHGRRDTTGFVDRKDVEQLSGEDVLTDAFVGRTTDVTDDLNYEGQEKNVENVAQSGTETDNHVITDTGSQKVRTTDTGGYTDETTDNRRASGVSTVAKGVYGVGGSGMAPESSDTTTQALVDGGYLYKDDGSTVRTYQDRQQDVDTSFADRRRTDNSTKGFAGRETDKTSTKTFTGREDSRHVVTAEDGSETHTTEHGQRTESSKSGQEYTEASGTDAVTSGRTTEYVGREDVETTSHGRKDERTASQTLGGTSKTTDEITSEGSSALRTYQALINEEVEGRSGAAWNFTELVIANVQKEIASIIWKRERIIA